MNRRLFVLALLVTVAFGMILGSSNYQFQIELVPEGTWVDIPFELSTGTSLDYIDATQSTTYGTIAAGPPSGMGIDDSSTTNMTEAGYVVNSWTLMEGLHTFGSTPSGWTLSGCSVTSGYLLFATTLSYKYAKTLSINTAAYDACRIEFDWANYAAFSMAGYTINGYVPSSLVLWTFPSYEDTTWHTNQQVVDERVASTFYFRFNSPYSTAQGKIDNVDVYARTDSTYYRFQAVFTFSSVTGGVSSAYLYIDFLTVLTGSDDLDFYLEQGDTTPDNLVAADKQDDFYVDVTSYVTGGANVYLDIRDDYRDGDTVQTTAYIQRCYLSLYANSDPTNNEAPWATYSYPTTYGIVGDDFLPYYWVGTGYFLEFNVSDADGYADIETVELSFYDSSHVTLYYSFRIYEATLVTEELYDPAGYCSVGSTWYSKTGVNWRERFRFNNWWTWPSTENLSIFQNVTDSVGNMDTDWYDMTWDIVSDIDVTGEPTLTDDVTDGNLYRGDISETISARWSGTAIVYAGTAISAAGSFDMLITSSDNYWVDEGYVWERDFAASSSVGLTDYNITFVLNGITNIDANKTTIYSRSYITDRAYVYSYTVTDTRVDIGTTVNVDITLKYDYDDAAITTGTWTLNANALTHQGSGVWRYSTSKAIPEEVTYDTVAGSDTTYGIDTTYQNGQSVTVNWDKIHIDLTSELNQWSIVGYNDTIRFSGYFMSDSLAFTGTISLNESWYPVYYAVGTHGVAITEVTDSLYGITEFEYTAMTLKWDDIEFSSGPSYYWTQYSPEHVWLIWGAPSSYAWSYDSSTVELEFIIQSQINGTDNAWATMYGGSIAGLSIGAFDISWYYVNISIRAQIDSFDWIIWTQVLQVDILHSLQIVTFSITPTDYHFWIMFQSNLMNSSVTIWDDVVDSGTLFADAVYHSDSEGMHQIPIDDTVGDHHYVICITSKSINPDKDFAIDDYIWWYNFTNVIEEDVSIYETNIIIVDNLGQIVEFSTFEVYKNGTRLYAPMTVTYSNIAYNITVKDRWGETLNSTVFPTGDYEFVLVVNVYSFKVMSWHSDFVYFNITHAGLTWNEVIAPLETIYFRLFQGSYTWGVNYRNGTSLTGNINLINSTALVVTGSTIADVAGLSATLLAMTMEINVTVTATNNYVLTIQIDLDNINATIGNQLIQILLNITNTNSTIYSQTVDLLAYLQNVNSTLFNQVAGFIVGVYNNQSLIYAQTLSILSELSFVSSNVTASYISLYSSLNLIDSSLASNFTLVIAELTSVGGNITTNYLSLAATLNAIDSSLLANFTSISATLTLIDSSLLSNFTTVMAALTAVGSNVTANYLSLVASLNAIGSNVTADYLSLSAMLINVNSTILNQTVTLLLELTNLGGQITDQTVTLLLEISNLGTNITAQTVSILTEIQNVNMTLYNQTVWVLTYILNTNSTLFSQTIKLLSEVDTVEEQATIIDGLARKIQSDLPSDPVPVKEVISDIWTLILKIIAGSVVVLIIAIILSTVIRALLNDRRLKTKGGTEPNAQNNPIIWS